MPLCFAYGSNMDVASMAARCPKSRPLGVAKLARHRFAIMPDGYGNVVRDPVANVPGVLWDIALADMRALDAYEQVASGLYTKVTQPVVKAAGGSARALVYMGKGEGGRPTRAYMELVIAAARAWNLPAAHVRKLETFLPPGAGGDRPTPEPVVVPRVRPRFATPLDRRD